MELLQTYPGRLKPLARNIFTLILVGDPLSPTSFSLVQMFYKMYSGYYPIRFGESATRALQTPSGVSTGFLYHIHITPTFYSIPATHLSFHLSLCPPSQIHLNPLTPTHPAPPPVLPQATR